MTNKPNTYLVCLFLAYTAPDEVKHVEPYTKNTQKRTIHLFEDLIPLLRKYELEKKKNQLRLGYDELT